MGLSEPGSLGEFAASIAVHERAALEFINAPGGAQRWEERQIWSSDA